MKRGEASLGPVTSARESVQSLRPINLRHTRRWRTPRVYSPLRLAYDTCVLPAWRAPYCSCDSVARAIRSRDRTIVKEGWRDCVNLLRTFVAPFI